MAKQLSWDRVAERADDLLASVGVGEDLEVGIEQLVRLADGQRDTEPVASGRDGLRGKSCTLEPGINGVDTLGSGSNELFNLWNLDKMLELNKLGYNKSHLFLSQMLTVARAGRRADGVKSVDQSIGVALDEGNAELDLGAGIGRGAAGVPRRGTLA